MILNQIIWCQNVPKFASRYIKEFVHGDFGRTKPNLTELLSVDCDILELDVQVR